MWEAGYPNPTNRSKGAVETAGHVKLLLAGFIEFLAGFIKLSHTILLQVGLCSLLLADCDESSVSV